VPSSTDTGSRDGIREVGSSDATLSMRNRRSRLHVVGLDAAKQFEANIETTSVKIYLVAQTKGSIVYYTDDTALPDITLDTWVSRDADDYSVPAEANGLLLTVDNTGSVDDMSFRHGDSTDNFSQKKLNGNQGFQAPVAINGANEWGEYMGNTGLDVFIAAYTKAFELADHEAGQLADAFTDSGSETNAELFGFRLDSGSGTMSVTQVIFTPSSITGLSGAGVEIVEDNNSDGTIGGGETTTVGGSGTVDQGGGTITFTTSFNVTAVTNYILRADFASLADADAVTIDLTAANITASATISGNTTSAVHTESSGGGGGGGGAQSFYYLETPVDVTPGVSASWETVDLSSQVPDGATGCIIRFNNLNNSDMDIGLRKPGSSDNHTLFIYPNAQLWAMSGVDSNRYVEVYLENVANVEVWITGYTTAGVTFFTNGKDKSLGSTGTWQDIDISADTAADTAVGVIVEVNGAYQQDFGVRMNGSSDEIYRSGRHSWAIIGVDGSEIFEGKISDTNIDFFVVGYITDGATFFTNALDKSLASTGAWTDIDISADTGTDSASGAFIEVVQMGSPDVDHGFRKKGTSQDMIGRAGSTDSAHMWAVVELDSSVRG